MHWAIWGNPDASAERFAGRAFSTGDLARRDQDGFFYIEGRKASFIKSFGFRVSPYEVEDVLAEHDEVAEVVVTGEPDELAGEALVARVVRVSGGEVGEEQLLQHCRARLPNHKLPGRVVFVDELPRNEAGKLLRHKLRGETR